MRGILAKSDKISDEQKREAMGGESSGGVEFTPASDQTDAEVLNTALAEYLKDERYRNAYYTPEMPDDGDEKSLYQGFSVAFGVRIAPVVQRMAEQREFEGFRLPRNRGTLYVSVPTVRSIAIAGHEFYHELAEKYGDLKRLEAELEAEGKAKPPALQVVITEDGALEGNDPLANAIKVANANLLRSEALAKDAQGDAPAFSRQSGIGNPFAV